MILPPQKKLICIHLLYIVIRNVTYVMCFFVSMDIIWQIDIKNPLLYISNAPFSVSLQTKRTFWKTYIEITMFVTKWSVCLIFSCDWDFAMWGRDVSELRFVRNRDDEVQQSSKKSSQNCFDSNVACEFWPQFSICC